MNFLTGLAFAVLAIMGVLLLIAYVGSIVKIADSVEKAANSFEEWVKRR